MIHPFGYASRMDKKPPRPCPFTPEELADDERGELARLRRRIRKKDPRTMAMIEQGRRLAMARIVPPEVWATDPAMVGKAVEEPKVPSTATPPAPDDPGSTDQTS